MRISFNTQNFKGYSNLVYDDVFNNSERCMLLSMKLDNEGFDKNNVRYNDLDKFREFKEMYNMPQRKVEDDVLSIFYNKLYDEKLSTLYVSDEPLFWGSELKIIPNTYPDADYKIVEKSHMKIYTLLSSLLNRIIKNPSVKADSNYERVATTTRNILFAIAKDFNAAQTFVTNALEHPNAEPDIIAEILNKKILKTMQIFFR